MSQADQYIPGTCNIGKREIALRKAGAWIGIALTILTWATLACFRFHPLDRLLVFIPAMITSLGFLQAYFHFCVHYGFVGAFNITGSLGKSESIQSKEFRKQDRQTALRILALCFAAATLITTLAYFLP